ncbi:MULTISPECIES: hypothetical protein [unclassified Mesorhizobium]|uniref:hypothetical protein n=1 Tax=unclassified Mesorhizobium TaxID=325217 RepID=UPI0033387AA4
MGSALHVAAGFAAGVAGMGAIAAWGSSPQAYWVSCGLEGVKTDVKCRVTKMGRLWNLDSGWYVSADAHYPDWKVALGADCSDRYREYRDYVDTTWEKIGNDESTAVLARSDPRFYFDCYNRAQN